MSTLSNQATTVHPGKEDVAEFYDTFSQRLIRDYVRGNRRVDAAIQRVVSRITPDVRSILDVGCGIGLSSAEYAKASADVNVLGVDISPRNIEIAKRLSKSPRVEFRVSDMTDGLEGRRFDLIALLDVYEHFAASERESYHEVLAGLLSDHGTVVLTTPSRLHQEWLAENRPEGLQVIDEIVTYRDIARLADDLDADVMHYQSVSIWSTNDYVHTVLQRQPQYQKLPKRRRPDRTLTTRAVEKLKRVLGIAAPSEVELRQKRVADLLGIEI